MSMHNSSPHEHDNSLKGLYELLDQKNKHPGDGELENQFYNAMLIYLLTESSDHWWCSQDECIIAQESLWLFSLPDHKHILQYKEKLNAQLSSCVSCLQAYWNAKQAVRERYEKMFSSDNVKIFFQSIDMFDKSRLVATLQNAELSSSAQQTTILTIAHSPHFLADEACDLLFCRLFDRIQETNTYPNVQSNVACGIVVLAFHHHRAIRFWARKLLEKFAAEGSTIDTPSETLYSIGQLLVETKGDSHTNSKLYPIKMTLDEAERWKAFRLAIGLTSQMDTATLLNNMSMAMPDLILSKSKSPVAWLPELVKTLRDLTKKMGTDFWKIGTVSDPYCLVKAICENAGFHEAMKIAKEGNAGKIKQRDGSIYPVEKLFQKMIGVLDWVPSFWKSLPPDIQSETTPKLLDMLLGYFQLQAWSWMCRAYTADIGFEMLKHVGWDSLADDKKNNYIATIVTFAALPTDRLLSQLDHVTGIAAGLLNDVLAKCTRLLRNQMTAPSRNNKLQSIDKWLSTDLWHIVDKAIQETMEPPLFRVVLQAYQNIAAVDIPPLPKRVLDSTQDATALMNHIGFIRTVTERMVKIAAGWDEKTRKQILSCKDMLRTILQCACSPYPILQKSAIQFLASPGQDNAMAIQSFFSHHPQALCCVSDILDDFNKISMDIAFRDVSELVPPLTNLISNMLPSILGLEDGYLLRLVMKDIDLNDDIRITIKSFWNICWRTIGLIAEKAFKWAEYNSPDKTVSGIIPVFDIGGRIVGAIHLFQKSVDGNTSEELCQLGYDTMCSAMDALHPWIYITRTEVLAKLMPLIIAVLKQLHNQRQTISLEAYDKLVTAATGANPSRLSDAQKESLLQALKVHEPSNVIFIDDSSDEDDFEWQNVDEPSPSKGEGQTTQATTHPSSSAPSPLSKTRQITLGESFSRSLKISSPDRPPPWTSKNTITAYFKASPTPTNETSDAIRDDEDDVMDDFDDFDFASIPDDWLDGSSLTTSAKTRSTSKSSTATAGVISSLSDTGLSQSTTARLPPNTMKASTTRESLSRAAPSQTTSMKPTQKPAPRVPETFPSGIPPVTTHHRTTGLVTTPAKPIAYAVTSTGRRLKQPSMGFSRMRQLREEFKAERKLSAASKSPSASAASRKNRNMSASDDSSSSSDDSSSDEESGLRELVADTTQYKNVVQEERESVKALFQQPTRRSIKLIETVASKSLVQKQAKLLEAEQRRKKVAPNINRLFKVVLSWDIESDSELPPGASKDMYMRVPDTFDSFDDYVTVFEPLLLLETWMQIVRSRDSVSLNDCIERCMVESRCTVDDYVDITFNVPYSAVTSLAVDDLVCIANSFGKNFFRKGSQTDDIKRRQSPFLGKVISITQKKKLNDVIIRCFFPFERIPILNSIATKSQWCILRLMSLTTTEREYTAMQGLAHFDLADEILHPKVSRQPTVNDETLEKYIRTYGVNEPQAKAIAGVLRKPKGFTLIQGPPGTGKTKTILGLIVSLLDEYSARNNQRGIPITVGQQSSSGGKLLVCAPSNAAVDEIAKRLKEGVVTSKGLVKPKVVRVGIIDSVNSSVKDLVLDRLVDQELMPLLEGGQNEKWSTKRDRLNEELRKTQLEIEEIDREIAECKEAIRQKGLQDTRNALVVKRNRTKAMIKDAYDVQKEYNRELDFSRLRARQKILGEAEVVCATLSGSGHEMLGSMGLSFETVIVDEAAQSIEISSLIPLKYDCKRCVLVGDPNQLPPTVLSMMAAKYSYEQSLFMRLQKSTPDSVFLLSIQYRMHPDISKFPSKLFYQSRLTDGPDMANKTVAPWHTKETFPPYIFYNVEGGTEKTGSGWSLYNAEEAEAAVTLVDKLACQLPAIKLAYKIGIITPYKQQLSQLKSVFERRYGPRILDVIDFNTVDGFQGQEKDIIIFSCVRASTERGIGFLSDIRRMNVGLTRAKRSLFVLGHERSLSKSEYWGELVNDAKERGLFKNANLPYFDHKMIPNFKPPNLFAKEEVKQRSERLIPAKRRIAQNINIPSVNDSNSITPERRETQPPPKRRPRTEEPPPSQDVVMKEIKPATPPRPTDNEHTTPKSKTPQPSTYEPEPFAQQKLTLEQYRAARGLRPLSSQAPPPAPHGISPPYPRPPGHPGRGVPMRPPPHLPPKTPNLFIQKKKPPMRPQNTSSRRPEDHMHARDRAILEHEAAKEALREIRRREAQRKR